VLGFLGDFTFILSISGSLWTKHRVGCLTPSRAKVGVLGHCVPKTSHRTAVLADLVTRKDVRIGGGGFSSFCWWVCSSIMLSSAAALASPWTSSSASSRSTSFAALASSRNFTSSFSKRTCALTDASAPSWTPLAQLGVIRDPLPLMLAEF
jgi:hypothetical protein